MLVGVKPIHRVVIMGNLVRRPDRFEGTVLSGSFFPRRMPSWFSKVDRGLRRCMSVRSANAVSRFLARGSYNDYVSEPTTEEVRKCLAGLTECDCVLSVRRLLPLYARGCAPLGVKRHYFECSGPFWSIQEVREATMLFRLNSNEKEVELVGAHRNYLLGVVARQLAEVVRAASTNVALEAA